MQQKTAHHHAYGVNISGHLSSTFGLGEGVRSTVKAVAAVSIPYTLNDLTPAAVMPEATDTALAKDNSFPINIVHTNPDILAGIMRERRSDNPIRHLKYFRNKYNIGIWTWETPIMPSNWKSSRYLFDEIWAPSRYAAGAISPSSSGPVMVIPHCMTSQPNSLRRSALSLPEDKFIFLFIYDEHSNYERKNPQAIIRAFNAAFGRENDRVLLILKSRHLQPFRKEAQQQLTSGNRAIMLLDEDMPAERIRGLLANCDCYVSLHRSEGFGLTLAEAMHYGKPVIATAYSGNLDFMNKDNSFLVKHRPVTLERTSGSYRKGTTWADPDVHHAAQLMRHVYDHQAHAAQVGQRAASDIRTALSPESVGTIICQRLDAIRGIPHEAGGEPFAAGVRRNARICRYFINQKFNEMKRLPWKMIPKFSS